MWHNAVSHKTDECGVFHQQIQKAIEQGKIMLEEPDKSMKINRYPLPASALDIISQEVKGTELLVPSHTKKVDTVGLQARVSAGEMKHQSRYDQRQAPGCLMDDFLLENEGKLGQGFTSADGLEHVDIGDGSKSRPTFVSAKLSSECK